MIWLSIVLSSNIVCGVLGCVCVCVYMFVCFFLFVLMSADLVSCYNSHEGNEKGHEGNAKIEIVERQFLVT